MKKLAIILSVLLASIMLASCTFSNNQEIKIKDNLTRSEFVKMDYAAQRSILGQISPETKYELYKYKYAIDLKENTFTKQEREAIDKFLNKFLKIETFINGIPAEEENELISYFQEELKWTNNQIHGFFMTPMTLKEFNEKGWQF